MKVLLIYPPFCTPASPPYSITNLYSYLKPNSNSEIEVMDLNLEFHKLKFPEFQKYYQEGDFEDYDEMTSKFRTVSKETFSGNNKKVLANEKPEFFDEILKKIKDSKPDVVAFSVVYSSQAFYTYALLKELKDYKTVIGGPSANMKLIKAADEVLCNEKELLNYLDDDEIITKEEISLDFSIYKEEYFTPEPVIPIKTSTTCYYKGCAYCSHFSSCEYEEYPLKLIKKTIENSKQKYFFIIDEMIPTPRLLEIAKMIKPLNVFWTCQLKPIKNLTYEVLKELYDSGLTQIMWGLESGCDRILKLMRKGTNKSDIQEVLQNSHKAGIKNIAYIIFGFPTETKEEFIETINFLKENNEFLDLLSPSIFGLHEGTIIEKNPARFGITKIIKEERTILEPKISYEVSEGLTNDQARRLRQAYKNTLNKINKYPKTMNFFREHMFVKN